eukprot:scaffold113272_cov66-Phaeocystis_antarctica.AAC.2
MTSSFCSSPASGRSCGSSVPAFHRKRRIPAACFFLSFSLLVATCTSAARSALTTAAASTAPCFGPALRQKERRRLGRTGSCMAVTSLKRVFIADYRV